MSWKSTDEEIDTTLEESFWRSNLWPSNHSSSPPPPLIVNLGKEEVMENSKGKKREREEEEGIIATIGVNGERERRRKMRILFANLQALLPHSNKVDKTSIVEEAIRYIKALETYLETLQHPKESPPTSAVVTYEPLSATAPHLKLAGQPSTRESFLAEYGSSPTTSLSPQNSNEIWKEKSVGFQTWTSSNVVLNTFGKEDEEAMIMTCSRKKPGLLTAIAAVMEKHMVEVEAANVFSDEINCSIMIHARLADLGASEQYCRPTAEEVYKEAVKELMLLLADNQHSQG